MPLIRSGSAVVASIDEALSIAQQLIDADQRAVFSQPEGAQVSCRPGCAACCSQAVPVGPAELRAVVAAVKRLPAALQRRIADRVADAGSVLRSHGFSADSVNVCASEAEHDDLIMRYFALNVVCPLLDDGVCSVRADRPLACREYLVTSDPRACSTMEAGTIVRLRSKRDVLGGYASLERSADNKSAYVLALALSEPIPESAPLAMAPSEVIDRLSRVDA